MSEGYKNNNERRDDLKIDSMSVEECERALSELEKELSAYSAEAEHPSEVEPTLSTTAVFEPEVKDLKELDRVKADESDGAVFAFKLSDVSEESEGKDTSVENDTSSTVTCFNDDELFIAAARLVVEEGVVSTFYLQRRLQISHARAVEIVNRLEELAIISPADGNRSRKVMVSPEKLEKILSQL